MRTSFSVGDVVVHPDHGIGQVVRLEEKRFHGVEARLYYEVNMPNTTVWVPVEAGTPTGLRSVTGRADLPRYRHTLISRPTTLDKDRRQRQLEVSQRLKQGTFQVLCEVVRDLTASSWRKALNEWDSLALRRAYDNLCHEWALSENVPLSEARQEIEALLTEARQAHHDQP